MLISFIAFLAASGCGSAEKHGETTVPSSARARVETIVPKDEPVVFEATGTVRSRLNATLAAKVFARVAEVRVREGDAVRQGQVLVLLDSRELKAAVDVAGANLKAANVGIGNAATVAEMESRTSTARIAEAEAQVGVSKAALAAAQSKYDLALAGPRAQEKAQAHLAVLQAESTLRLATTERERAKKLFDAGVIPRRQLDIAQNAYDVAKAQYDIAVQAEKIAAEGTREQEIRAAREAVAQAEAGVRQAEAGLKSARAAAMQTNVRKQEIESARAQSSQSAAALRSAQVNLAYGTIIAPFDGRIVRRLADPGAMAGPGTPLIEIEGGEFRIEAVVPEGILGSLQVGGTAEVRIDATQNRNSGATTLRGTVAEIVPQGDPTTHSFIVKFALPTEIGIKSGMFGRVKIHTGSQKSILVPVDATWEREGLHYVFAVNKEGIARLRIVSLGNRVRDQVEVFAGLTTGDRIVVGDRQSVADGVRIEAIP